MRNYYLDYLLFHSFCPEAFYSLKIFDIFYSVLHVVLTMCVLSATAKVIVYESFSLVHREQS